MMKDNSEVERPPEPNWGEEITVLTESSELMRSNAYDFSIDNSENHLVSSTLSGSSRNLSPTEEYLQLHIRLIESNSLPPHITMKLKELYIKYKSIKGYGPATFDEKTSATDRDDIRNGLTEIFKHHGPSKEIESTEYEKVDREKKSRSRIMSTDDPVSSRFSQTEESVFGQPCDPEAIKIDNIFSDFSLSGVGHDKMFKKRISQWVTKESRSSNTSRNGSVEGGRRKSLWKKILKL